MKRNKVARMLAAALSTVMVFSLAACSGNQEKDTEKENSEQNETEESKDDSENNSNSEITELSFYSGWGSSTLDDAQWFTDILAEELGIKLEVALGNGDKSVFSTLLASGELTDVTGLRGNTPYTSAANGDMLLNLDDYKDQLPNIFNNSILEPSLNRTRALTEDGGLYGLPLLTGEQSGVYITPKINWSTYYQLGCPEVETEDDFLNVLKQMQEPMSFS